MKIIKFLKTVSNLDLVEIIRMLASKKIINFRIKKGTYDTDYSLENTWCRFESQPEQCEVNIHGLGYVPISESPQYAYINKFNRNVEQESNSYEEYLRKYYPNENVEKSIINFEELLKKIKSDGFEREILAELPSKTSSKIRVVDGTHRLAILTALGVERIKFAGKI